MMSAPILFWAGSKLFTLAMLALDLGVFHRRAHAAKMKEALAWSGVWIGFALLFNLAVYFLRGRETALAFLWTASPRPPVTRQPSILW